MGAGSVFLRRGGGTIDRGRCPVDAGGRGRPARPDLYQFYDQDVPLEYRPVRHLAALPQEPHLRRRELSVVRNQAAATSRGVLYGAARGAVEPRNA